jgi:uncharacterized membrane protein YhhN
MNTSKLSMPALYTFYIVAIINLFVQVMDFQLLDYITKPLLMITLLVHYLASRKNKPTLLTKLMAGALVFSWLGDVILMLQGRMEGLFVFGLGAFLIAHVFYIVAYRVARTGEIMAESANFTRTRIIFLVFIGGALVYLLFPGLGEMLIPVALYTIVIIAMAIAAVMRKGRTIDKSFIMVYSGALLFIMSDSMIAINKFLNPLVQARLMIMATYIAAQLLIVKGILAHENATMPTEE